MKVIETTATLTENGHLPSTNHYHSLTQTASVSSSSSLKMKKRMTTQSKQSLKDYTKAGKKRSQAKPNQSLSSGKV